MNTSDSALLDRWITRRDPEAMALIVSRYSGMVYATCKRVTRNAADAEDIAQECFLKLSSVGRAGTSLAGLLHTMATRLSLNKARSDARRRAREAEYTALHNATQEPSWDEIQPLIDEAIAALPEERNTVIIRHFLRGETHGEIADDLGLTRAAISKRVAKGVDEVRETLRRQGVIASIATLGTMLASASAEAAPVALTEALGRLAVSGAGRATVPFSTGGNLAWSKAALVFAIVAASVGAVAWRALKVERPPAAVSASNSVLSEPAEHSTTSQTPTASTPTVAQEGENGVVTGAIRSALGTPQAKESLVKPRIGMKSVRIDSDESGHFQIPRNEAAGTWVTMDNALERSAIVTIAPTQGPEPLEIAMIAGVAEVFGQVTGPDGSGIVHVEIEFEFSNDSGVVHHLSGWSQTRAQGYYTAYLPAADGFSLRVRVAAQQDEALSAWSAPIALSKDIYYAEIPDLSITSEAATRLASLQQPGKTAEEPYLAFGGSVVDADGKPIAGARLYLIDTSDSGGSCRAKTDAQGRWQRLLPAATGRLSVDVWHPDFVPSRLSKEHSNPPSQDRMRDGSSVLVMERGTAVKGVVRDNEGRPAGDVLVKLLPNGNVRTDADGRFTTPSLPVGQWSITLAHPQYAATAEVIDVPSNDPVITLVIDRGGSLKGRVAGADGKPIAGARVRANELYSESAIPVGVGIGAITNALGEFHLERIPTVGQVRVTVEVEADATGSAPFLPISTFELIPRETPYEITLYPPPRVEGTVVDSDTGKPLTEFTVENRKLQPPRRAPGFITSFPKNTVSVANEAGNFSQLLTDGYVDLVPNVELVLDITAPGYQPASSPVIHVGAPLEPLTIRMQRAEQIQGTILGVSGAPKEGVPVAWANSDHRIYIHQGTLRPFQEQREIAKTGANGHFDFFAGGRGGELIAVCEEGYVTVSMDGFKRGEALRLLPWASLRGVFFRNGLPCAEVNVGLRDSASATPNSKGALLWGNGDTTHVDGTFSIDFVPGLPIEVGRIVSVRDRQNLWPGVSLEPKPGEALTLDLGGDLGSVTGRVVIADSEAWNSANIRVVVNPVDSDPSAMQGPEIGATVSEDGAFLVESLAPGNYTVTATLHGEGVHDSLGLGEAIATGTAKFSVGAQDTQAVELPDLLLETPQETDSDG